MTMKISYYEADAKKLEQLKRDILDVHDELVEQGLIPSVRRIKEMLPYSVSERLVTHMRQILVEDGDLPPTARGNPKAVENGEKRMSCRLSEDELEAAKAEIVAEHLEAKLLVNKALEAYVPLDQRTAVQVASWAIGRYRAAWRNITKSAQSTGERLNRTLTAHHPVYAGSGSDVF